MKVRYTRRALADSEQIHRYLSERSPVGAARVMTAIDNAVRVIADNPQAGLTTDVAGTRVLNLFRYPYRIFYRATPDAVEILHVRHMARRPITGLQEPGQAAFAPA